MLGPLDGVACPRMRELRRRGYVMWDHSRLVNWGFFRFQWHPMPREDPDTDDGRDAFREAVMMILSWRRRRELYDRGARGWWSENDESKLVWSESAVILN